MDAEVLRLLCRDEGKLLSYLTETAPGYCSAELVRTSVSCVPHDYLQSPSRKCRISPSWFAGLRFAIQANGGQLLVNRRKALTLTGTSGAAH